MDNTFEMMHELKTNKVYKMQQRGEKAEIKKKLTEVKYN